MLLENDEDVYDSFTLLVRKNFHIYMHVNKFFLNFHVTIMKICILSTSSHKIYSTFLVTYWHSLQNILGIICMQSPSSYEYS